MAQPIANIPPAGTDAALFPIFRAVDSSGTGQLTEEQLGRALRNGDYSMFDPETVRLMIKMFDHDHSGTIGFEEFW
jgi:Ca2+-binding EF-hand superfamily protein